MLVSLLAWVSNAHTEQEESWNDSSSHSLLAACQLEAIAGKGSQTDSLTQSRGSDSTVQPRGHIWKGGERWIHPLIHLMSFTFEKLQIPSSKGEWGETPCSCWISLHHKPTLTVQETEGELHQLSTPCSATNNSSKIALFYKLGSELYGDRTTHCQPPNSN